jgi:hypothetical protein
MKCICNGQSPSAESAIHMLDQTLNEAEERDAYEDNQEEPVSMIEESPPDVDQDGLCS